MSKLLGFILTCVFVPGLYASGAYYLASHHAIGELPRVYAPRVAFLIALPLLVSGLVNWWDAWEKPAPKLGAYWSPIPPTEYAVGVFRGHSIVAVICIV